MRGQVLNFDLQSGQGLISGTDGGRYAFAIAEWTGGVAPRPGQQVDFEARESNALQIYPVASQNPLEGDKNKLVAALLAFFLGAFGAHKFYLGYTKQGTIMLVTTILGFLLSIILIGIFMIMAMSLISFVEFIIYLVTPDHEFEEKYVRNQRPWF